jgi:hypothetical protein
VGEYPFTFGLGAVFKLHGGRQTGDSRRGLSKLSSAAGHHRVAIAKRLPDCRLSRRPTQVRSTSRECLPRKEVIQPQLPLRLPCYDFTPITSPTFDGSLPKGLGHRLRVLPAFVV